ncbi:MAG TPA: hypothetical protein VFA52_01075 [Candidatus Paceibacterota bacterium]|nr:hypothetical protein [Candidatus Paceibacterota bacterium]
MDYDGPSADKSENETPVKETYYYAEPIRVLFFIAAIIMLICFPLFSNVISLNIIFVLFGIMLIILAGFTNRKWKTVFYINAILSLFIIAVLEVISLNLKFSDHPFLVLLNQILALLFVISLYFCLRTIRGFLF